MAVRVEDKRRRGFPWWLLALLALALIGLVIALLVFAIDDDEEEAARQQGGAAVTTTEGGEAEGGQGAVVDIDAITGAADAASLAGRRVELTGVQVQSVVGDKTFWVGPSEEQQVFVFLEEEQDAAGVEGKVDVNAGETVSLTGTIEQVPASPEDEFDLSQENSARIGEQQIYVRAETVEASA